jgi:LemA protein
MKRRWLVSVLSLLAVGCGYNRIQTLDEQAQAAKQNVEVQLQRRADLIPNLVNTVKGYAAHESKIFTEVAEARSRLINATRGGSSPPEIDAANDQLTGALGRLLAISEAYPQLKADQQFIRLQDELSGTENRVAVSRNDYNETVRQYNTYIRRFPTSLTAKVTGAKEREYFRASAASQEVPQVDFTAPAGAAPPR